MRRWLARARDVRRLEEAVQALRDGLAGSEAREEDRRRECADLHALIDDLRRDRGIDQASADERVRALEQELRKAEEDRLRAQTKLEIELLKLQRTIDLQAEQLGRTAAGLLDRIHDFQGRASRTDA
ncbi:hypothetical protein Q4F19_04645 [Sphingomonas sp. BIUV-7]|uniref:Uncharacterized protein n=1 Tax=Sphingomonas natans TaxID=3063330 RepID=A0ABT8Y5S1_9SPHN|nr:hypothetical protein [Sphingomonas sp. BIUV-7]MDO6413664.1 hypothetical protein [Sphingomonas sp. BIUV-7]